MKKVFERRGIPFEKRRVFEDMSANELIVDYMGVITLVYGNTDCITLMCGLIISLPICRLLLFYSINIKIV